MLQCRLPRVSPLSINFRQILTTRARKNVVLGEIKVDVCIFAFDMLYLNGKPLIQEQLKIRREHLYDSFKEEPGFFQFATAITSNGIEEIQTFLDAAVNASCEGLIIKTLDQDATYEPSKRSNNWLKLKKDYMDSIGDSVDLVPIAAFHGRGKRTGLFFKKIYQVCGSCSRLWFEPSKVWEVKAADLTISPVHCAAVGIVDPDKGISLRFSRLVRVREDKAPERATPSDLIAEMYSAQKHNHPINKDEDEDD